MNGFLFTKVEDLLVVPLGPCFSCQVVWLLELAPFEAFHMEISLMEVVPLVPLMVVPLVAFHMEISWRVVVPLVPLAPLAPLVSPSFLDPSLVELWRRMGQDFVLIEYWQQR